ncbi:hypothetical protein HYPSUDRAFT_40890 [Hypholoma sublateritium FD-334 SS-4]|uniref:Uncharacterized protein n=1 Tax=Hypholoma sublateritium (strain FD-334 SS-4) TaxID=945553 RepID=A0A0D2PRP9_HYPSF|nr:hypothetical protein HYPSUDRAFT_40890 [Hypholoma sublateritium FD-334 SS-4]
MAIIEETFHRTLGFFCTLFEKGCRFDPIDDGDEFENIQCNPPIPEDELSDSDSETESKDSPSSRHKSKTEAKKCQGRMIFHTDPTFQYIGVNIASEMILRALFDNNTNVVASYELAAQDRGYGPLQRCIFKASPSAQKQLCRTFHVSLVIQRFLW